MKNYLFPFVAALAASMAFAVPQLKTQSETAADGEVRIKPLAAAHGIPAPTLEAHTYVITRNGESKKVKMYSSYDIWRLRAFAAEWKDKKGNAMRLAKVKSLVPSFEREHWYREEIDAALDRLEKEFGGSDEELAEWKKAWGGDGRGSFVTLRGGARYYIDFEFAEPVPGAAREKMMKAAVASLSPGPGKMSATNNSMKWWSQETPQYKFLTDLDKAKGGKFIKDSMRLMEAMRKSYEFYVPPTNTVGQCTVRVFKTMSGYKEYLQSTNTGMEWSCGLWDPSREELLICAEDRDQALNTMRHEAFHQYLHYATGNGHHALWFNEGHACFFENVQYNPAKNTVKVVDKGNRAMWVDRSPEAVARRLGPVAAMSRDEFYSGDINDHYVASWALVYFLEKGSYTNEDFAPYRKVVPKYLEAMAGGSDSATATAIAFREIYELKRDMASDFLKFWTRHRKQAVNAR